MFFCRSASSSCDSLDCDLPMLPDMGVDKGGVGVESCEALVSSQSISSQSDTADPDV